MAFEIVAFADGAGRTYSAASMRRTAYNAARGQTSIIEPTALKVTATTPASTNVLLYPGSADLLSPHASGQVYTVSNPSTLTVAVPANGTSSPITRHVIVAVRDPNQAGMPAASGPTDNLTDVFTGTNVLTDRPVITCAAITIPGQTSTIQQSYIADTRPFPNAHMYSDQSMMFPAVNVNMPRQAAGGVYQSWPLSDFSIPVPPWATLLQAEATINGAEWTAAGLGTAGIRMIFATIAAQNGIVKATGVGARQTVAVMGEWAVPSNLRGSNAYLGVQGLVTAGTGTFQQDTQSQTNIKWTFKETKG